MMSLIEKIFYFIFQKAFSQADLKNFHHAPFIAENWIFPVWDYQHKKVKKLIRHLKNKNDFLLKREIAQYLYEEIQDYLADQNQLSFFQSPLILPVPISKKRLRERGFNQTESLAYHLAKKIHGEYRKDILIKIKKTKKQALIHKRKDRFKNVQGAFGIAKNKEKLISRRDIIIVDDLVTTGATLLAIHKVLKKHGARKIIAVTIAH